MNEWAGKNEMEEVRRNGLEWETSKFACKTTYLKWDGSKKLKGDKDSKELEVVRKYYKDCRQSCCKKSKEPKHARRTWKELNKVVQRGCRKLTARKTRCAKGGQPYPIWF